MVPAAMMGKPALSLPHAHRSHHASGVRSRTVAHCSAASSARREGVEVSRLLGARQTVLVWCSALGAAPLGLFSHLPPAPRTPSLVGLALKECSGKRPYHIYLAKSRVMDALAYSIVNKDLVHVFQWNSVGAHSVKMSRAAFAVLPRRSLFLYQGRSTAGQCHMTPCDHMSHDIM